MQRLIGSAIRTILTCVDQRFVSYWEVMYGTWHASYCSCCLFWSTRFTLQCKSIFFNFFWNAKLFLRLYKGFRSFNYSPKCLLDRNNWKRFSFVRECDGFLQCFVILSPARYFFVLLLLLFIIIIIIIYYYYYFFFARVKEWWGVGKKGRKRLQTNPSILKTVHLDCHAWVYAPTFDAVISCHNWPKKCLSFWGAEMNLEVRVEPK